MSMEINVLFCGALPDKAALAQAVKELGFPITIPYARGPLDAHKGFLPMRLRREKSGVEFDVFDGRAAVENVANGREVDPAFDRSANFRWGGDEGEMLCALCVSAALARLTGGGVLGEDDDRPLTPDQAIAAARQCLANARKSPTKETVPGTRPSDIKRYLEPLLALRSDLALVGRWLIVRPVRHLLRGAFLDRTGDKYCFRIWWAVHPLYYPPDGIAHGKDLSGSWWTWQPYFQPLLMSVLAENLLPRAAAVGTLADLADDLSTTDRFFTTRVQALVLAGEHQRAIDYVREVDQRYPNLWDNWADEQRAFLARDIQEVCAEFRAREAENAKAMKLEAIWEPSPFPAELPEHERHRVAEPAFSTTPWLTRPAWLYGEMPVREGDVRFAQGVTHPPDGIGLFIPQTREEAEVRHRDGEYYVVAARIEGLLVVLRCGGGWDRNDPRPLGVRGDQGGMSTLEFYDKKRLGYVMLFNSIRREGCWCPSHFSLYGPGTDLNNWSCSIDEREGAFRVWDGRGPEKRFSRQPLTDADLDVATCPVPRFGEVRDVWAHTRAWLRRAGYGEITQPPPRGSSR